MSAKKNIPQIQNNAANQLNYSSDNNYNSNHNSNNLQFSPTTVNNFENGLICYNKADYRSAINYLEIALEDANASNKEDIEYYMAMSYQKMGREKKAEKIFKKLMLSSKYKSIISDKLIKTKK
jgi:tetratricopeptide (TPR) repeat protein